MADFEMQDFKAAINIGQVGTGTLEGRITGLTVQEFDGKDFKDSTVIRADSTWRIKLDWELAGTALEPGILALNGAWVVKAYLEGWGAGATETELPGDLGANIKLMDHKPDMDGDGNALPEMSRIDNTLAAWLYTETITIDPAKTTINEGPYRLAVTVTYQKDGVPGPMAGFVEFDKMIQIYKAE